MRCPFPLSSLVALGMLTAGVAAARGEQAPQGDRSPADGMPPTLQVIVYNIRYATAADGADAWPHRAETVAEVIRQSDVAGLQEALRGQIDDLEEALPEFAWFGAGRDDGQAAGEYVPIFYRSERFEKLDGGHFWLSETPEVPGSRSWDAAITRMVTWLRLRDRRDGVTWFIANTHFDHRGSEARLQSARLMRQRIPGLAGEDRLIVMGDLNCRPEDPPYQALISATGPGPAWVDTYDPQQRRPEEPAGTWNAFRETAPRRIDFIFSAGAVRTVKSRILDPRTPQGRFASDHHPVLAELAADHE